MLQNRFTAIGLCQAGLLQKYEINIYFLLRLTEMEILYKKEKEEADQLLEQQRLVRQTSG